MTKQQAKAAMQQGHKVRHYFFSPHEWVKFNDAHGQMYLLEDGVTQTAKEFWQTRWQAAWNDDWEVVAEPAALPAPAKPAATNWFARTLAVLSAKEPRLTADEQATVDTLDMDLNTWKQKYGIRFGGTYYHRKAEAQKLLRFKVTIKEADGV